MRHRDGGRIALIDLQGTKKWYVHGVLHRGDDLPAVEHYSGRCEWYQHGRHYREGGKPHITWANDSYSHAIDRTGELLLIWAMWIAVWAIVVFG